MTGIKKKDTFVEVEERMNEVPTNCTTHGSDELHPAPPAAHVIPGTPEVLAPRPGLLSLRAFHGPRVCVLLNFQFYELGKFSIMERPVGKLVGPTQGGTGKMILKLMGFVF